MSPITPSWEETGEILLFSAVGSWNRSLFLKKGLRREVSVGKTGLLGTRPLWRMTSPGEQIKRQQNEQPD